MADRGWVLRDLLAGTRDTRRVIEARDANGVKATFRLYLPAHRTVDNYQGDPKVEWKIPKGRFGYIKIGVIRFSKLALGR